MPQGDRKVEHRATVLAQRYAGLDSVMLLHAMIRHEFPGRIAVVSSFGSESAVLLAMAAAVDPQVPVIFLETGKHFEETRRYRDKLIASLGLGEVRLIHPEARRLAGCDPAGTLWRHDPEACCHARKVAPLRRALAGFDAWITGRKRYQGDTRADLATVEASDGKIKINPLADWTKARIEATFEALGLPRHPLEAEGFLSIGCQPCSHAVPPGSDLRAGRWSGSAKTECGIHFPAPSTA